MTILREVTDTNGMLRIAPRYAWHYEESRTCCLEHALLAGKSIITMITDRYYYYYYFILILQHKSKVDNQSFFQKCAQISMLRGFTMVELRQSFWL